VRRIELGDDGNARIIIDVPRRDAHWLRQSSVFTLVRGLVGSVNIRAYSGILSDPPLPDGAERKVLAGDATTEIPHLVSAARDLVQNLTELSRSDSALGATLGNAQTVTERLKGPHGALGVLLGSDSDAKKLITALERTNALLARVDGLAARVDGMAAKADAQVFGADGVMPETRAAIIQLNATLADARSTLKKADALLETAQGVAANARVATTDLGTLRAEVEASLRKVEHLVNEINRKWPFARDSELKLR
jgi:phospholipid/cholesterol/gamma-HCH transport system substrate-binding protein